MKKIFLSSIAALAIGAVAVFNLNIANQDSAMSDVSLANVEALASGENGVRITTCLGLWGTCTLPSGTISREPAFYIEL